MERFVGKLGAGSFSSEKPVILFDDFNNSYREFDTIGKALEARDKELQNDQWAILKTMFQFSPEKSEYKIQTGLPHSSFPN